MQLLLRFKLREIRRLSLVISNEILSAPILHILLKDNPDLEI